ncbi:MAG TPA: amidase [Acidimicrobiales bacterium]|nr:amidase [Acidimicrobiales bacterium]
MSSTRLLASAEDPTAVAAIRDVATGARTVSEIASTALARAADVESQILAFSSLNGVSVERRAKELDAAPAGPLRGVAVGVKDVIDTADSPTGYGSPLFSGHQPAVDADVVARLRALGAIVFGKTESTEFAMFEPTRTRNPADVTRTPGGSSSGSAAAVAAGIVPIALGTQTAGSVVRPGAYCGVYAFKPSKGWTSTKGVWLLAESFDTLGLFARTAADLGVVYRALRSPGFTQTSRQRPVTPSAALLRATEWAEVHDDVLSALDEVAAHLSDSGWKVVEMRMPEEWRRLPQHHTTVMAVEVAKNMRAGLGERVELISEKARRIVADGDDTTAVSYLTARAAAEDALGVLPALAETVDVILAPSALGVAPIGLANTGDPVMCRPWTLLGLPASNVPAIRRADGLPVGVQAVSTTFDDLAFLDMLASIEAACRERQ